MPLHWQILGHSLSILSFCDTTKTQLWSIKYPDNANLWYKIFAGSNKCTHKFIFAISHKLNSNKSLKKAPIVGKQLLGCTHSASIIDQLEIINQPEVNNEHHLQNKFLIIQTKFKFRKMSKLKPRPKEIFAWPGGSLDCSFDRIHNLSYNVYVFVYICI